MTATTLHPVSNAAAPTLAVAAGRNLIAAGAIFGAANLFQWSVLSGAAHIHPAMLSLSWPAAVALFILTVRRLRSLGGEPAVRAAAWSRWSIAAQIAAALSLAAASVLMSNWELMRWMSPIGLGFYGLAFGIAVLRGGPKWLGGLALGALIAATGVAQRIGTPEQYLAYAGGLFAFALIPGAVLAFGRAR